MKLSEIKQLVKDRTDEEVEYRDVARIDDDERDIASIDFGCNRQIIIMLMGTVKFPVEQTIANLDKLFSFHKRFMKYNGCFNFTQVNDECLKDSEYYAQLNEYSEDVRSLARNIEINNDLLDILYKSIQDIRNVVNRMDDKKPIELVKIAQIASEWKKKIMQEMHDITDPTQY